MVYFASFWYFGGIFLITQDVTIYYYAKISPSFFRESSLYIFLFLMKMESVNDDVGTLPPDSVTDLAAKTLYSHSTSTLL